MAEFHTAVSEVTPGVVNIRGYSQADIMRDLSYTEGAFLTIIGRIPSAPERRITEVILNSLLDHGWVASTITAARYVASGNPQFIPAVAGGILAAGANTLSPEHSFHFIEAAMAVMADQSLDVTEAAEKVASDAIASRRRVPGFGHPVHRDGDFRADIIFEVAEQIGLAGPATTIYRAVHAAFVRLSGKTNIPINIDGCLACVGHDLGWSANQVVAFATLAVLPGLMAHVIEEIDQTVPLRYIHDGDYVGRPLGPLAP
jgi:citrate synthase